MCTCYMNAHQAVLEKQATLVTSVILHMHILAQIVNQTSF